MDLRTAFSALNIDRRDDTRPVDGERKAPKLVKRAVFRVRHAEELCAGCRPARCDGPERRARVNVMEGVELVPAGGE